MSAESAKAFLDKLNREPTLRAELGKASGATASPVTLPLKQLVELAARQGFTFSSEEIVQAYAELGPRNESGVLQSEARSELTDEQLQSVAGGATVVPTDSVSLNYAKITFSYAEQTTDGSLSGNVSSGYDLKLNKKV
jgi:predicted ribosomally synthesized peptide with nif11-like leader